MKAIVKFSALAAAIASLAAVSCKKEEDNKKEQKKERVKPLRLWRIKVFH